MEKRETSYAISGNVNWYIWRRKWQPTPVFLPGESQGQRSLVGYSPRGHKESDTTEHLTQQQYSGPSLMSDSWLAQNTYFLLNKWMIPRSSSWARQSQPRAQTSWHTSALFRDLEHLLAGVSPDPLRGGDQCRAKHHMTPTPTLAWLEPPLGKRFFYFSFSFIYKTGNQLLPTEVWG